MRADGGCIVQSLSALSAPNASAKSASLKVRQITSIHL